ncbi:hypothetical protein ACFE04_014835 [Oxalis oulophora]
MGDTSAPIFPSNLPIPVDLFVSKKHRGLPRGVLGFADSDGNVVYKVQREIPELPSAAKKKKSVLDSLGNTLITLYRYTGGAWEGFKGGELIFKAKRTEKTLTRYEFEVFFIGESNQDAKFELKVKGSPFQRANTIYNGDSIVAQLGELELDFQSLKEKRATSLMYKLNQIYARRSRCRVTIFPGPIDHAVVAALIVIFFDGRKFCD